MGDAEYVSKLEALEFRMATDSALRRRTGRVVYFSSVAGAGLLGIVLLGWRFRMTIPKLILYAYTVNPVSQYAGEQALRVWIDELLREN